MTDVYDLFPSVRKWRQFPEEIQTVTSPQDFDMPRWEEKLLNWIERIDHRLNHVRQDIAFSDLIWLRHPIYDWVMPDNPCHCDY